MRIQFRFFDIFQPLESHAEAPKVFNPTLIAAPLSHLHIELNACQSDVERALATLFEAQQLAIPTFTSSPWTPPPPGQKSRRIAKLSP